MLIITYQPHPLTGQEQQRLGCTIIWQEGEGDSRAQARRVLKDDCLANTSLVNFIPPANRHKTRPLPK
ncbi:hypothetical protein T4D_14696 [Trichinella pseudospiralis]|uniref:Uncharacterized protein n=1 Tax=Trichinella pseudospiralis TaxID=6337 RepID=A0A0V1FA24_TRIPS|nr:hypothetical protein T4D_14696 [Trichinella pseudospiralis]